MKRTNLVLDAALLAEAQRVSGERTYSATVLRALEDMVRRARARQILDLQGSGATTTQMDRAQGALRTKDGLYARGRFAPTPDGGRVFRALRLYLRAPQPRA